MFDTILSNHHWYAIFPVHWIALGIVSILLYEKYIARPSVYGIKPSQRIFFYLGVSVTLFFKATPLHIIGTDYLFSMYMMEISAIFFITVPLLLLSIPVTFLRQVIWNHQARILLKIFSHPWLTLVGFNGLISIYFIPSVFNVIHGSWLLTALAEIILAMNAFFMWWVIIHPLSELKGLSYMLRALYIFLASTILMPTGFFYIIVLKAHFPVYEATAGTLFPVITAIYDQQIAGGVLKFTQILSYAFALLLIFNSWGKQEQAREGTVDEENIRYARGVVIHLDKDNKNKNNK